MQGLRNYARVSGHPNVLALLEAYENANDIICIIEPSDGAPLSTRTAGAVLEESVTEWGHGVVEALAHCHEQGEELHAAESPCKCLCTCSGVVSVAGVVHCGLSPDSILLTPGPAGVTVQVTGFHNSQLCATNSHLSCHTETTLFTAPEVSQGYFTAAADVWSLGGIVCWELLGQVPCRDAEGKLHCQSYRW